MQASLEDLATFFERTLPHLNEKQRLVAGAMALSLGRGGQSAVAEAGKMSRHVVIDGMAQLRVGAEVSERQRVEGGGARLATDKQPGLLKALEQLVQPHTRGDPSSNLLWTLKSTYRLADELVEQGFRVSSVHGSGVRTDLVEPGKALDPRK